MLCTNPSILINPSLVSSIHRYTHYHTPCGDVLLNLSSKINWQSFFPYKQLGPRLNGVTPDNISEYYFFNANTGAVIPTYIQVPCGKCLLCRDAKKKEWEFRAHCENATSETEPLFITLTYAPEFLPDEGLCKRDVQLFMKRLRFNLSEEGFEVSYKLRYFCCGEYGSRGGRPHYHLIFWNFPEMQTLAIRLKFIENAWSQGFCYCVPVRQGAIGYVMKYMRKDSFVPAGKSPCFFLSSRRNGGIGSKYLMSLRDYFYSNPSQIKVSVTDPYTNVIKESVLPRFFRNKLWPSFSQSVSRVTRQVLARLSENVRLCQCLYDSLKDYVSIPNPISGFTNETLKRFVRVYLFSPGREWTIPRYILRHPFGERIKIYDRAQMAITECVRYLNLCESIDIEKIVKDANLKTVFSNTLQAHISTLPAVDVSEVFYRKKNAASLARSREIL